MEAAAPQEAAAPVEAAAALLKASVLLEESIRASGVSFDGCSCLWKHRIG
jgi:hypothetical protein